MGRLSRYETLQQTDKKQYALYALYNDVKHIEKQNLGLYTLYCRGCISVASPCLSVYLSADFLLINAELTIFYNLWLVCCWLRFAKICFHYPQERSSLGKSSFILNILTILYYSVCPDINISSWMRRFPNSFPAYPFLFDLLLSCLVLGVLLLHLLNFEKNPKIPSITLFQQSCC